MCFAISRELKLLDVRKNLRLWKKWILRRGVDCLNLQQYDLLSVPRLYNSIRCRYLMAL